MVVLIVEDDPVQRRTYLKLFELHGHKVILTQTAIAAVDVLRTEKVDLVILDYELDGTMTGVEVAHFVVTLNKFGHHCEVFMVSGFPRSEIEERSRKGNPLEGVSLFFDKPLVDFDLFLKAVQIVSDNAEES